MWHGSRARRRSLGATLRAGDQLLGASSNQRRGGEVTKPPHGHTEEPPVPVWEPLRVPVFRLFWLAILGTHVGVWMQLSATQWLLVSRPGAEFLVAAVLTANNLPVLLFCLPAGALADTIDKRSLLLFVAGGQACAATVLTVCTAADVSPSALLLALTFVLGTGLALTGPTWQAAVVDVIPRNHLTASATLGSISINIARAVGPALAGLLLVYLNAVAAFAANAMAALFFFVVVYRWRPVHRTSAAPRTRLIAAIRTGARYARQDPVARRILLRVVLFAAPASGLWAVLPLLAAQRLHLNSAGYGLLLGALGAGAVVGGLLMPWAQARLSVNRLITVAMLLYAASAAAETIVPGAAAAIIVLLPAGAAWIGALATLNALMQLHLPFEVRGRGLAIYVMVNSGVQAAAAAVWGGVTAYLGPVATLLASAVALTAGAATVACWPVPVEHIGRTA
jgi:MFS family permease